MAQNYKKNSKLKPILGQKTHFLLEKHKKTNKLFGTYVFFLYFCRENRNQHKLFYEKKSNATSFVRRQLNADSGSDG
jgi:hypothetical protein